ncbi:dTDP-4-amino-4,6-dideoxy-D-glucose transaminase [Pseudomonas fluorescens]|uniref:DegT/DnrJ/EryC1/StrS family aminotransferase n=1 Tax=Pseudomonas fluorescens TaxID=294 RepID=UPI001258FBF8|nr:DegT/DnrJ/EryC1/StrS family aminotransferase [Pseudomonas fluorescens]CAG8867875.1 dTDP-4-amino-4,6-dideoxy-D-glucose transaminase [Pseudomonas fluorescens]VVP81610.1 dTDP-4-amino-4,6-dideoxy-D-glucose transaminase [Pseudomonas fluorescens]
MEKLITVTSPLLPPLEEFLPYLEQIWQSKRLTNNGPFHEELEESLARFLGVPYLSLFNNGTTALITALQALGIQEEVITTPYTFVATPHALVWNRLTPVFVDIDPRTFNIDPAKIEAAITPRTTAIMPVHCYGCPCDVEAIQAIADKHGLRVLYDAAHAFGVNDSGGSILRHGDLSVLSLHATKVFNTFEGGAIISPTLEVKQHIDQLRNFGFVDETTVMTVGINGKMSEINAAFGLVQLNHVEQALQRRREIDRQYRAHLRGIEGIQCLPSAEDYSANYAYFPILVDERYGITRDALYECLKAQNIFARRYFYPLVTEMAVYKNAVRTFPTPAAHRAAARVICLPIYPDLQQDDIERVVRVIRTAALSPAVPDQ